MTADADAEPTPPRRSLWAVHFLFGQTASSGQLKSRSKWIGKGGLSIEGAAVTLVGQRHRYFWFAAKQEVRVAIRQVRNVVAAGRLVRFEVEVEGPTAGRVEVVRLRTDTAQAALEIAAALPTTRTEEFERALHEKIAFDRSMEQLGTRSTVTATLVAANVAWFLFVATQGGGFVTPQPGLIIHWGSNYGPLTLNGEWWRLFTSMFVHFGLLHLVFNMWVLWSMGRVTERMFGSLHYALVYVLGGLCGSMASLWWHPNVNSAGASGAIFGLVGGLLAFILHPTSGVPPTIVANQRRVILIFVAYNLVGGFTHQGVDNAAHLGGLVGGFLLGWLLARPIDVTAREQTQSRLLLVGLAGLAGLSVLGWRLAQHPHPPPDFAYQQGTGNARIHFQPGSYRRIVFDSGEQVSTGMRALHDAADASSLNTALSVVEQMADSGNAEAAFRLGRYYDRESNEPNYELARKYYQMASEKGHAWATNNLGALYSTGRGVAKNDTMADDLMHKAAIGHSQWAHLNLADAAFYRGEKEEGIRLLEEGGHDQCTLCLVDEAAVYHSGAYGIPRDDVKVITLLNKAAALGDSEATLIIAELELVGDGVTQSTAAAIRRLKTLSEDGDGYASTLLGELSADDKIRNYVFESALGGTDHIPADLTSSMPQDPVKATRYWEQANRQGSCQSWVDLSSFYDRGVGMDANLRAGADAVERATHCDPTNAFVRWKYAMRFYDARGRDRDCLTAEKLFKESLDHGYADAGVNLGYVYDKGCAPIAQDDHRALEIYLLCAKLGVSLCENNVGAMIKHGRGIEAAEPARGYGWIRLAALQGNELAKANLQDPLFTPSVRANGLAQFEEIQHRLRSLPATPQAILRDAWY